MPKQNIIFNLDDTLIECNKYFNLVNDRFAAMMAGWFKDIAPDAIKTKQMELDLVSIDKNGLTVEHLPQSFVGTYQFFCAQTGKKPQEKDVQALTDLGYSVFTIPVEPFPFMYETLQQLKEQGHDLYLHTGGEEKNQRRKIAQLQLAAYFDNRIFISRHKDLQALVKIMNQMQFDPSVTWMVGNSLRTDILPGLEQGIHVIYIPAPSEWHYNMVEINVEPKGVFLTLNSLNEVPEAIRRAVREQEEGSARGVGRDSGETDPVQIAIPVPAEDSSSGVSSAEA